MESKFRVKGIIIDLDGTVVDSREAYFEAAKAAFSAIGQKIINIKTVTEIPKRLEQDMPIDDLLSTKDVKRFRKIYLEAYYRATATRSKPFPEVARTLEKLSKKAKLALITRRNVSKTVVVKELERFHLARYFEEVVTSLDTQTPKPSPEALVKCLKHLDVRVSECVVVGDSIVDIRAGKNAGTKTAAVLSGIFTRDELENEKPDLILKSINELPAFVE